MMCECVSGKEGVFFRKGGGQTHTLTHRHACKSKPSTACDEVRRSGINRVCRYHGSHFHLTGRETGKKNTKSQLDREGGSKKKNPVTDRQTEKQRDRQCFKLSLSNI